MAVPSEPAVAVGPASPERAGAGRARKQGIAGLTLAAASYVFTAVTAALGPSLFEPALPGRAGQPPWSLTAHPSAYLVVALSGAAIIAATTGITFILSANKHGWLIPAAPLLLAGIAGALLLAFLPPIGSSDHLSYAAYGRMAVTGHNPYTTTPAMLARLGDPVARAVQDWRHSPSVYGSLAVAVQALAATIGGTSVRLIVFVLSLVNVAAFAGTGLILHRLGRGDQNRQFRSAVLWTANPMLLLVLVAGAHIDSQAIVFGTAAVALAVSGLRFTGDRLARQVVIAAVAGALIGLGFAVKVTTALIGAGIALGLVLTWSRAGRPGQPGQPRRPGQPGRLAAVLGGLAAGFAAAAGVALIPWGTAMFGPAVRGGSYTSIGSPWRAVRSGLRLIIGESAAENVVKAGALLLAVVLLAMLVRYVARTSGELACTKSAASPASPSSAEVPAAQVLIPAAAFAFVFAWLLAWPYVLPWYDGLGWALLALLPASRFDWLMLARTAALAIGYLPARGIPLPAGLGWLETVVRTVVTPVALLTIVIVTIIWLCGPGEAT
jgi:hypothetical protein